MTAASVRLLFASAILLVSALMLPGVGAGSEPQTIEIEASAALYEISKNADGLDSIDMQGFRSNGDPGSPMLPRKMLDVALPPDVDWDGVSLFDGGDLIRPCIAAAWGIKVQAFAKQSLHSVSLF